MAFSSSSSATSTFEVTREEFNAFHKIDRTLFSCLVLTLNRDISQSLQVMSFLLFLEKSGHVRNLIADLISLPDVFINKLADEVVMCLTCLSYENYSMYVANHGQNNNSFAIPSITRMTGGYLTLPVIQHERENILSQMKKHLNGVCYPAFEDIRKYAEIYNKEKVLLDQEREKMMENLQQLGINTVHKGESSNQILSGQEEISGTSVQVGGAVSEDEQVTADDRTVFLTFSRGYPISEPELHDFFTRKFGDVIEEIFMPGGGEQALYARMVLRSAAKVPEIVTDGEIKTKFTISGKHVWARKFIPSSSGNTSPSS
ncbi:hypothetical protein V5N11_029034 [Cardamine amara subsp. amara]|uniref:Uncharacterized protein n=1 Tax=Cardamine amara subsp. amara TaxID=228776 RepID=A0ABD0Z2L7_CARAN